MAQPDGEPAYYEQSQSWDENPYDQAASAQAERRDFRVIDGGKLEITDDMRRMLPPGAVGRIMDAALDAPPHVRAKAELQKLLASGAMSTGSGRAPFHDPSALNSPYSHGVQG